MELSEHGFEKPELIQIAEKLYELRGKKQQLEIQLSSEEFHKKYIPQREEITSKRIFANLPIVIVFGAASLLFIISIILCTMAEESERSGYAFSMLLLGVFLVYIGRVGWKLLKEELQMMVLFSYSSNPDKAMRFARKYGINTFQDDRIRCDDRINNINVQINVIDEQITKLEMRQNELIEKAKKRDAVLKKYDIIKDQKDFDARSGSNSSLSLKKEEDGTADIAEVYEYYDKEASYIRYLIKDLQIKLNTIDKEIVIIDEQFEIVKKRIIIFLIVYVVAIIIQSLIPGIIGGVVGGVCLVTGLTALFAVERACRGPVLRYLIEKESTLVAEYCFKNDIIPAKNRRQEIVIMIRQNEDLLNDIEKKKQALGE